MIPEPPIQPAPLAHTRRRLLNGLDVIAAVRPGTGTVAVQVWYKVGGKDDPAGRSGFAHLFEHLMFKRTRNLPDEGFDRLTEDVGGENNAYTTPDTTVYHEVVPSEHLETILWAEAERLANLQVTERVFLSERDVVKEEYRQGVLAPPYGRFDDAIERTAWGDHPYQRTVIGNLPELDAARVEEAKAFHAAWYRPDNAVLVVAGDFVPSDADRWIDRYFGRIPAPARAIGRMSNPVAERTSERRVGVPGPNVPLPAVAVTYGTPAATASGTGTLQLLDALLASGKSSRLFRELVYRRRTASEVGSWLDLRTDGGTLVLRAVASEKTSAQRLEDDLHDVASALATNPVPTPELERARDRILASWLAERETASGIARILGDGAVVHGDPGHSDKELAELLAATPESVRAAAAQLFRKENRTVVVATRGKANVPASRDGAAAKAPKETPPAPNEKPPAPGAPRPAAPLSLRSARMDNGLRFIGAPKPGTGLVTLGIVVPGGAAHDPSGKAGLADMAADLLLRGTKTRSAQRIAEEAESLGGMLEAGADRDTVSLSITVPAARLAPALALLADVVRNPVFAPDEVARVRGERRSLAGIDLQDPGEIAGSVLRRLLYGNSGYGNRVQGTPASIARIDQAGCIAWHAGTFHPALTTLVVVGDVDDDAMQRAAESTFASWNARGPAPRRRPLPKVPPIQRRVVLVDNPDSGQAAVRVGRPGMARNDPDFATAMLANSVLGGGFSSRLNKIIRIERGLAYGAMSVLAAQRGAGPLVLAAQTRDDAAAKVAGLMVATLERLPLDPLSPAELAARKSALVGPMLRLMETGAGTAGELLGLAGLGIPLEETTALAERINTVGGDAVRAVVRRRLAANVASVVVVGDRRKCHAELRGRFGHVDVVPARTLDVGTYPPD